MIIRFLTYKSNYVACNLDSFKKSIVCKVDKYKSFLSLSEFYSASVLEDYLACPQLQVLLMYDFLLNISEHI